MEVRLINLIGPKHVAFRIVSAVEEQFRGDMGMLDSEF